MRLTDAQAAWNKLASEHNALRNEIGVLIRRRGIAQKKSPRGAAVLNTAISEIVKCLVDVLDEMKKMEGPDEVEAKALKVRG